MILVLGLLIDRVVGDPDWLWRRAPHPVVWLGAVITAFDRWRGRSPRASFVAGVVLLLVFAALSLAVHYGLAALGWPGLVLELLIVVVLLAQKSLRDHVEAVAIALRTDGIAGGRKAVSMIVGRDVSQLDEAGVTGAAIESLAENASDGIVAPALWYALAGVGGIVFYKAVNTADSMIGHRGEPYEWFGKPAAKLDDWLNWPAARLTALLVLAGAPATAWHITRQDAPGHRSPNAGWPEAAFATRLAIALGGPRRYGKMVVDGAWMNAGGRRGAHQRDLEAALAIFSRLCNALLVVAIVLALVRWLVGPLGLQAV